MRPSVTTERLKSRFLHPEKKRRGGWESWDLTKKLDKKELIQVTQYTAYNQKTEGGRGSFCDLTISKF